MEEIPVGIKQKVEILKALYRGADILILDEPTAVLTPQETSELFVQLKKLRENGHTIIFISHKLDEIKEICDRATIMRDGRNVTHMNVKDTNLDEIIRYMVGRELKEKFPKIHVPLGEELLRVEHLNAGKQVKDISFTVQRGETVGIIGTTGAGKTTLINLLMRFFEINSGRIKIDGVPTSEMTRESVHDLFSMVLQDTWLFEGTVRENLVYNKTGVTDQQLEEACRACGIYHFIETLPHGFDTVLDDSIAISSGQKQLLTIARAMIQGNPMLILDEATSSVDTRTELITQQAMDRLTEHRTSFVIAHRLSTIKNADLILVLKDGDIIEQGTHKELLAKGGFYADLYNSQFEKAS